uniref:Uncharacterized protein n=1 Tax=Arundo donax TaxID=35708 RepID=A0A0A9IXI8_ARUDO
MAMAGGSICRCRRAG